MFKNVLFSFTLLLSMTVAVMGQCTNRACDVANALYKECRISSTSVADFKKCLCTKKFLNNYQRCLNGVVCPWTGETSIEVCVPLYCPGKFDGGFDAKAFCEDRLTTSSTKPVTPTRTLPTLTPIYTGGPVTVRPITTRGPITLEPPRPTV